MAQIPAIADALAACGEPVSDEAVLAIVADMLCTQLDSESFPYEILDALEDLAANADDEEAQLIGFCVLSAIPPEVLGLLAGEMGPALAQLSEELAQGRLDGDSELYIDLLDETESE